MGQSDRHQHPERSRLYRQEYSGHQSAVPHVQDGDHGGDSQAAEGDPIIGRGGREEADVIGEPKGREADLAQGDGQHEDDVREGQEAPEQGRKARIDSAGAGEGGAHLGVEQGEDRADHPADEEGERRAGAGHPQDFVAADID